MKSEITYILGAGASGLSMPLVNNFIERFEVFEEYLLVNRDKIDQFIIAEVKQFKRSVLTHYSFDTYFKKLFHQNKTDLIEKHKMVLLLYFLFEHLVDEEILRNNLVHRRLKAENKHKKHFIDPRYEALIAGLLKPIKGKSEFFTNINFFTWNYDLNLLLALKNFIDPDIRTNEFINRNKSNNDILVNEQISVYHMNGLINHNCLNKIGTEGAFKYFHEIVTSYEDHYLSLEESARHIKFAWEQEIEYPNYFENKIGQSGIIILIGYSLPLYNRLHDTVLLNRNLLRYKKLYIQNLNPKNIAEILESDFAINSSKDYSTMEDPKVILSDNCNSFIVPNAIFQ